MQDGSIVVAKIPGEENGSDMTTKHLAAAKRKEFLDKLGHVKTDNPVYR